MIALMARLILLSQLKVLTPSGALAPKRYSIIPYAASCHYRLLGAGTGGTQYFKATHHRSFPAFRLPTLMLHSTAAKQMLFESLGLVSSYHRRRPFYSSCIRFAGDSQSGTEGDDSLPEWNLSGLRKEANRLILRQMKKVGKAELRHRKAEASAEGTFDGQSINELLIKLGAENERLDLLTQLEADLALVKPREGIAPGSELGNQIVALGVNDAPPPPAPRGPKKSKGPRQPQVGPRKPYRAYNSLDGIEIQVGRTAKDNDELSIGASRAHPRCWWMHAAGCPGSHVVILCDGDDDGIGLPKSTVLDAAALAANYSKAAGQRRVKVSLTRCRSISKPAGAKPGLVNINGGDVRTVTVDMKAETERLSRLMKQHPPQ